MSANLSAILYLVSGVLFILALRGLSSPETSRKGNLFGIIGMVIAVTVTFLSVGNFTSGFIYVLIFLAIGGSIGAFIAYRIPMTWPKPRLLLPPVYKLTHPEEVMNIHL